MIDQIDPWWTGNLVLPEDPLRYWIRERANIYYSRLRGLPAPWSKDPVFQHCYFRNVYHRQDCHSRWIYNNISRPHRDHEYLWFMVAIARGLSWVPTVEQLIEIPGAWPGNPGFSYSTFASALVSISGRGHRWFGPQVGMVIPKNFKSHELCSAPIVVKYVNGLFGTMWTIRDEVKDTLEHAETMMGAYNLISMDRTIIGWGKTLAYALVKDLRLTRYLNQARDLYFWAPRTSYLVRGLARLVDGTGAEYIPYHTDSQYIRRLRQIMGMVRGGMPPGFEDMEMGDLSQAICETGKYLRFYRKEKQLKGKPKYRASR